MADLVKNRIEFFVTDDIGNKNLYINRFLEQFKTENSAFDFNQIIPIPSNIIDSNTETLLQWQSSNWGVMGNSASVEVKEQYTHIIINFETAWSTPHAIFRKLYEIAKSKNICFKAQFAHESYLSYSGEYDYIAGIFFENTVDSEQNNIKRFLDLWYDGQINKSKFFIDKNGEYKLKEE